MKQRTWHPKNDRERAIWRAGHQKGWDDAFRAKLRRPEAGSVMLNSIALRGHALNEWGEERYQSMLIVHAELHNERLLSVDILSGGKDAQYEMTIEEAAKVAKWLTRQTSPQNRKPKGTTNG
jgi:hypothetical protein